MKPQTIDLAEPKNQEEFLAGAAETFKAAGVPPERARVLLGARMQKAALAEHIASPEFQSRTERVANKIAEAIKVPRKSAAAAAQK